MNGKMIANKPLYVALAQRKEDRRARLQVIPKSKSAFNSFQVLTQPDAYQTNDNKIVLWFLLINLVQH